MHTTIKAVASTAAAAALGLSAAAHAAEVPQYSPEQFYDTVSITGGTFNPDGSKVLYASDETGVFNLYEVPVSGGEPTMLTQSTDNAILGGAYFPNDERLLYLSDNGGNELFHVYVRETSGEIKDITPGERVRAMFSGWDRDDPYMFIQTNERNPAFMDLYRYSTEDYSRELVFQNDAGWALGDISNNGKYMILTRVNGNADNDVFLANLTTPDAEPEHITPHEGNVSYGAASFTPDSTAILHTSNEHSEWQRLYRYDIASSSRELIEERDWDIAGVSFSWNGKHRVLSINADAITEIEVEDAKTGRPVNIPTFPNAEVRGVTFSRDGSKVLFTVNGDRSPTNLFSYQLGRGGASPVKLTDSLTDEIDQRHLVDSEIVRYPSFDGLEIPALLYRPKQASRANPVPAIVWVHGGPGGQSRTGYRADIQALVNHGYAVFAVNNRGSSGYGKTFFHMDDRKHGEVDLQDCVWARKWLEQQSWIDPAAIGIMGGSYGGYMVCAALAFEPDAFDVGVNIFGVTNWLRTLTSIPPWWESFRKSLYEELGDPETDSERLTRISPLFHASNITKPMLVVQGANDPRVLQVESDEMVQAARDNGATVEYVLFPDEGHGFRKKTNRITALNSYLDFLNEHLRNN